MWYCEAKLREAIKAETFRIYVTDALKVITENTAKTGGGSVLTMRYADLDKPVEVKTGYEIAEEILRRNGLYIENPS